MSGRDPELTAPRLEPAGNAASTLQERAQAVLERLGRILPFDAGWLAVRDPERRRHVPLATTGPAEPLPRYFRTPEHPRRPGQVDRRTVAAVTSVIADQLDRIGQISETARIVEAAAAGVVLTRGGDTLLLPGLPDHRLLTRGSLVLTTAARELAGARAHISFLTPLPCSDREPLVRVTAIDCAVPDLDHLSAAVLLSPPGDLRGLRTLDLLVLGLLVEGTTSIPAIAAALGVDASRVTDALRAALVALSAPDVTAAAVRALRAGLRIPSQLAEGSLATTA